MQKDIKDFKTQRRGRHRKLQKKKTNNNNNNNNKRFYKQKKQLARASRLFLRFFARFSTTTT